MMDNINQVLRIIILLCAALFAHRVGFVGLLAGLAVTEMIGMLFMVYAVAKTFHLFRPAALLSDAFKLLVATAGIIAVGAAASYIPLPITGLRLSAIVHVSAVLVACTLAIWPALVLSKFVTAAESKTMVRVLSRRRPVDVCT